MKTQSNGTCCTHQNGSRNTHPTVVSGVQADFWNFEQNYVAKLPSHFPHNSSIMEKRNQQTPLQDIIDYK